MNFKKIMVGTLACSMVAAMSVASFADDNDGMAVLTLNDKDWAAATSTPVAITGDGEYTISGSFAEATTLAQFSALDIVNGETIYGSGVEITFTSIKFDGEEVLAGANYTCSADGAGVTTRANIFNSWNDPTDLNTEDSDNRATGKTEDQVSARVISSDYVSDLGGTKTVKDAVITFTVTGLAGDVAEESGDVAPVAYLAAIVAVAGIAMVASKKRA